MSEPIFYDIRHVTGRPGADDGDCDRCGAYVTSSDFGNTWLDASGSETCHGTTIDAAGMTWLVVSSIGRETEHDGLVRFVHGVTVRAAGMPDGFAFDFYGAHVDWDRGIDRLDDHGRLWAFRCHTEDAIAGAMDPFDFADEYGMTDMAAARVAYQGCRMAASKMGALGIGTETTPDLYDIVDALADAGIE